MTRTALDTLASEPRTVSRRSIFGAIAAMTVGAATLAVTGASEASAYSPTYRLTSRTVSVRAEILRKFPRVSSVGGYRSGGGDHSTGKALDFMVPGNSTAAGIHLGNQIASYARIHASRLGIDYVIWRQKIWSVARSHEGWRPMANRGSATANHMDHVHISVR